MNFTNKSILQIAMQQSALDANCTAEYFLPDPQALKALDFPYEIKLLYAGDFDTQARRCIGAYKPIGA